MQNWSKFRTQSSPSPHLAFWDKCLAGPGTTTRVLFAGLACPPVSAATITTSLNICSFIVPLGGRSLCGTECRRDPTAPCAAAARAGQGVAALALATQWPPSRVVVPLWGAGMADATVGDGPVGQMFSCSAAVSSPTARHGRTAETRPLHLEANRSSCKTSGMQLASECTRSHRALRGVCSSRGPGDLFDFMCGGDTCFPLHFWAMALGRVGADPQCGSYLLFCLPLGSRGPVRPQT